LIQFLGSVLILKEILIMKKHTKIKIEGNVQGVGLRDFVKKHAIKLEVEGHIKNLNDGTVQIEAYGTPDNIEQLIDVIYKGTPKASVSNIVEEPVITKTDFRGVFRVIGGLK
jgi:acylphosphatase